MKNKTFDYMISIGGIILFVIGLYLVRSLESPQGAMKAFPYICIGIGAGLFGHSQGNIITENIFAKNPDMAKQFEIDANDERNRMIANRAKAKAFDLMIYVYGAIMLTLSLMGVKLTAVLISVAAYLLVVGYYLYYQLRYQREM